LILSWNILLLYLLHGFKIKLSCPIALEKNLSFATKKLMIKCPKWLGIDCNNRILFQILHVKSFNHILMMHLISKRWHGNTKAIVIFSLQVFIHMAYTIDNKMTCHYIHNVFIKLFYNDSKMTINIRSHINNYDK
jgi:hypothetical protein